MIAVSEPLLDGNEKAYLNECIDSGWISSEGPFVERFEKAFAGFIGLEHGVAVTNGTAALETALFAIGIGEGDEVIMPSFTIISCAIACLRLGAKPVLVDIDPETWTMKTEQIECKITNKTKAIMAVHIYGHPVDMDPLLRIKEKYGIKIIEDNAETHGAEYYSKSSGKWLKCGAISDISATSFYANKIVTTGEGGMVLTGNHEYMERARSYRNLCFKPEKRFYHSELGYNFRMTNLQAAVGLAQVEQIERFIAIKRDLGNYYRSKFAGKAGIRFMIEKEWAKSVYWMYSIELDPKLSVNAEQLAKYLKDKGVASRPFFIGMHRQPILRSMGLFEGETYPNSDFASDYGLYLPSGLTLKKTDIDEIAGIIDGFIGSI